MEFVGRDEPTVGMELEYQLIDADSLDLCPGVLPLLDLREDGDYVKPEYFQSSVEVATPVCRGTADLHPLALDLVSGLRRDCARLGMRLCGAGTHPFSLRPVSVTPLPRYQQLAAEHGYLVHHQITFATQVHVAMRSGDDAVRVMRIMGPCMPVLIALSANSPLWRGVATEYASYRHRVVAASRSAGTAPDFASWDDFARFMAAARRAGMADTVRDVHWDLRPQPSLGTVEVRVADAQATVFDAMAIGALAHSLAVYAAGTPDDRIDSRLPGSVPWWLAKENCYRASHRGVAADYVTGTAGSTRPLRLLARDLLDVVAPVARELGEEAHLARAGEMLARGPGYVRQLEVLEATASPRSVVAHLADRLEGELDHHRPGGGRPRGQGGPPGASATTGGAGAREPSDLSRSRSVVLIATRFI